MKTICPSFPVSPRGVGRESTLTFQIYIKKVVVTYAPAIPYTITLGDDNTTLTETSAGVGVELPVRENVGVYTFAGWYLDKDLTQPVTESSVVLDKDTMLERVSAGDAAMSASVKAERKSNLHWTLVYLLQNPEWTGDAVCVDIVGKQAKFLIPSIAQETTLISNNAVQLNDVIKVKAGKIDIPNLTVTFNQISVSE